MPDTTLPRPRTPGPEMAALDRFYTDVTWTGTIEPNGRGPGSPAMTARGRGVHSRLHDGLWIVGEYRKDQFRTDGTFVLTWRLHWVTGWDTDAGQMPVCDEAGRVLGVISRSDVLAVFLRDDASIRAELAEVLGADAQGVQVDVRDGVVTLAGEVATRIDAERLVRVSERVEGVAGVADHLTYPRDVQRAVHVPSSVVDPLAGGSAG